MLKSFKKSKAFNLIEILISMIVIIFAMFIIVSFLPLSLKKSQEATNITHVANFSEQFISYLKSQTTTELLTLFPKDKNISSSNKSDYIKLEDDSIGLRDPNNSSQNLLGGNTNIYEHKKYNGSHQGFFKVLSYNTIQGKKIKEAEVEIRVWRSEIPVSTYNGSNQHTASIADDYFDSLSSYAAVNQTRNYPVAMRINVEFSWPIIPDYSKRKVYFYTYDINSTNR